MMGSPIDLRELAKRLAVRALVPAAAAVLLLPKASALPPELAAYDPSQRIRFATAAQAETKRRELIAYIWPDGLPVSTLPAVTRILGQELFAKDLGGLDRTLAETVERLDATITPYDFHGISYLVRPRPVNANNRRLVLLNSGHRNEGRFTYGVDDVANRLLSEGLAVLMMDMPLVWQSTLPVGQPGLDHSISFSTKTAVSAVKRAAGQF
ncbi:MAG: hypothetical protein WCK77_00470 [Verrucomicrobiota bacterium]